MQRNLPQGEINSKRWETNIMTLEQRLSVRDLFEGLSDEEEEKERKIETCENKRLEEILHGFSKFRKICEGVKELKFYDDDPFYTLSEILIPEEDVTADEIRLFSVALMNKQEVPTQTGYYISALCNRCSDENILIYSSGELEYIGYKNDGKNIDIKGSLAYSLGNNMKSGRIVVNGNVDSTIGCQMQGGEIIVRGKAGQYTGRSMEGGRIEIEGDSGGFMGFRMRGGDILVKGNAGESAGYQMFGGIITIQGNAKEDLGSVTPTRLQIVSTHKFPSTGKIYVNGDNAVLGTDIQCGEIYHKGRLIVKDARLVE
jgi:formylmethanofuran dehydrogenase subunit C